MHKYPVGGIAIGTMQVVDAVILYSNNGIPGNSSLVLSLIEFMWAFVSLVVLVRVKKTPTRLLAIVFFAYNVFGWLSAIFVVGSPTSVVVPIWAIVLGGTFGALYAAGSAYVAKQP